MYYINTGGTGSCEILQHVFLSTQFSAIFTPEQERAIKHGSGQNSSQHHWC